MEEAFFGQKTNYISLPKKKKKTLTHTQKHAIIAIATKKVFPGKKKMKKKKKMSFEKQGPAAGLQPSTRDL